MSINSHRQPPSFSLHLLVAVVLACATWYLWPEDSTVLRRCAAVVLSIGLGFQAVTAWRMPGQDRVARVKAWLECGAFLLVMAAVHELPAFSGWVLLVSGWSWRLLVQNLWKADES